MRGICFTSVTYLGSPLLMYKQGSYQSPLYSDVTVLVHHTFQILSIHTCLSAQVLYLRDDSCKFSHVTSLNEFSAASLTGEHLRCHLWYRGHCCCHLRGRKAVPTLQGECSQRKHLLSSILAYLPSSMVYPQSDRVAGSAHGGLV